MEKTPENAEYVPPREVSSESKTYWIYMNDDEYQSNLILKVWNDDLQKMFQRTC